MLLHCESISCLSLCLCLCLQISFNFYKTLYKINISTKINHLSPLSTEKYYKTPKNPSVLKNMSSVPHEISIFHNSQESPDHRSTSPTLNTGTDDIFWPVTGHQCQEKPAKMRHRLRHRPRVFPSSFI